MAALVFPNSPVDGQTVTLNGSIYVYRSAITAWELLFNAPPMHGPTHELGGTDELELDKSQITGLNEDLIALSQYAATGSLVQNLGIPIPNAENLLRQAAWWIDAGHSSSDTQFASNLGWGGNVLNARSGSSETSDSNDPTFLDYSGTSYIYLPGIAGNFLSVPDSNELDVTGNIDIQTELTLDTWVSAPAIQRLVGKHGAAGNRSYLLSINTDGTLQFIWFEGITQKLVTSTAPVSVPDGNKMWIRVTLDVDNNASGNDVIFYTSFDGQTWTQLGTTVTTSGVTSIASTTAPVEVGNNSSLSSPTAGKIHRVKILNGINGIPVLDIDTGFFTSGTSTTFPALTGQTVTMNRSSSASAKFATIVTAPCWLMGSNDYLEVVSRWQQHTGTHFAYFPGTAFNYMQIPDAATLDITGNIDVRARVALEDWTPQTENVIMSKAASAGQRSWYLSVTTDGRLRFSWSSDGTNWITRDSTVATGLTDGSVKWIRATLDVDNGGAQNEVTFFLSDDNVTYTTLGSVVSGSGVTSIFSSTSPVEIGSVGGGTSPMTGKLFRAMVYQEIGGTVRADIDINTNVQTEQGNVSSFTATVGGTVTIFRSSTDVRMGIFTYSGYPTIGSDVIAPSTYSLLDFGASDSFTIIAVSQMPSYYTNQTVLAKTAGGVGYSIRNNSTTATTLTSAISDGTFTISGNYSGRTAGELDVQVLVRNTSSDTITPYYNGIAGTAIADGTTGSLENGYALRVGRLSASSQAFADMKFYAAAVFRRALTANEVVAITRYFEGRVRV